MKLEDIPRIAAGFYAFYKCFEEIHILFEGGKNIDDIKVNILVLTFEMLYRHDSVYIDLMKIITKNIPTLGCSFRLFTTIVLLCMLSNGHLAGLGEKRS